MNRFARALRQARHDAALGRHSAPVERPAEPVAVAPAAIPRTGLADDHLVSLLSPAAFEAEQYRALRHIVEQMHRASGVKIIAVSSPTVGDGKTTTAINLAGALAQSPDTRVLLVDADVRRPAIGSLLGHAGGGPGLVEAILGPTHTLDEVVLTRPEFNLAFIPSGQGPPASPYELLRSPRLGEVLDEARRRFDYVVVDTPPMAAVQDCRLIARWVDGFLMVVAAHRTPRRLVEEALAVVEPAKILGFVFNGDDDRRSIRHYGYTGGYFDVGPARPAGRGPASPQRVRWAWPRRETGR